MAVDIDAAVAYNRKRAPSLFLCQSTGVTINPRTPEGVAWVVMHQGALKVDVDGKLGPGTQGELVCRYGPFSDKLLTLHRMPIFVSRWGYDHAHEYGDLKFPIKDTAWESFTSHGRWHDAMFRLVSGWKPGGRFSRDPKSWISLDEFSIGIAHYWAGTAPKFLSSFVKALPELSARAWGAETAEKMRDPDWIREQVRAKKGKRKHQSRYNWICAGWWWVARHPEAMKFQAQEWLRKYGAKGRKMVRDFGWASELDGPNGGQILAACIRIQNSGSAYKRARVGREKAGKGAGAMEVLRLTYQTPKSEGGYGKESRWEKITTWEGFQGPAPKSFKL